MQILAGAGRSQCLAGVNQRLKSLTCPNYQKLELLDAVILTVKERAHTPKTLLSPTEPDIST